MQSTMMVCSKARADSARAGCLQSRPALVASRRRRGL